MERIYRFKFENKEYKLAFTSGIELDFLEEYELNSIFDLLEIPGKKRIEAVTKLLKCMNEKAGGEQLSVPEDIFPADMMIFQNAVLETIMLGFKREVQPGEIDEGLAELEKKKEGQPARTSWFSRARDYIFQSKKPTTRRRG